MARFSSQLAPLVRRHPGMVFGVIFCPYFIAANGVLAALGAPKQPHDVSAILLRVIVACLVVELGTVFYRRFASARAAG